MDDMEFSESTFWLINKISASVFILSCVFGWFGNGMIVVTTFRSTKLRHSSNTLIALQATSDFIHQLGQIPFFYFSFGEILISLKTCFWIHFAFFSAIDFSTIIMIFLAIDRLTATTTPFYYKSINGAHYVSVAVATAFSYCVIFKYLIYTNLTEGLTLCIVVESVSGKIATIWFLANSILNVGIIVIYGLVTGVLKKRRERNGQLINSLNTIMITHIFGWCFTMTTNSVAKAVKMSHFGFIAVAALAGISIHINMAIPFYVYYWRSGLYRQEFRSTLGLRNDVGDMVQSNESL
ncbi:hypothetical protein L596_019425 [Steinernema carpocapsae]|uniref:G-protein coupled receptors family 1 profile domain-containing protein n=1 Tax=Steinernema carpocapsae TaxID=34508 RepID=A0A4U5MRC6_STECR|nr:hypothetical protein L596_019425 [Steinernema carpocapsae]